MTSCAINKDASSREPSDMTLVDRTRGGDETAFAELWIRHYEAAVRAARAITQKQDPEDMAQEAFTRILQAINNDGGPREAFRPYLYTVLRSISQSWAQTRPGNATLDHLTEAQEPSYTFEKPALDGTLTSRAFVSLKPQWRRVLWYVDVEGLAPREVAPLLGMSPNAVSALARRAREALRSAWLQMHLNSANAAPECRDAVARMGAYHRKTVAARDRARMEHHLADCDKCPPLLAEVEEAAKNLGDIMMPLLLGASLP